MKIDTKKETKADGKKETKATNERRPKESVVKEQLIVREAPSREAPSREAAASSNEDASPLSNGEWSPVVSNELSAERSPENEPLVNQRPVDQQPTGQPPADSSKQEPTNKPDPALEKSTKPSDQVKQTNAPVKTNGVKQIKQTKIVEIKVKRAAAGSKGDQSTVSQSTLGQPAARRQPAKSPQRNQPPRSPQPKQPPRSPQPKQPPKSPQPKRPAKSPQREKEEKKSSIRPSRPDKGDNKQRLSAGATKKRSLSHSPARPTDQLKNVERQAGAQPGSRPSKPPAAKNGATITLAKSVTGLNELKAAKPIKKAAAVRK